MNTFGISESDMALISKIIANHKNVLEIILYGSRAKGTYNERSDVDLVICNSNLERHQLGKLILEINNSNFPYTIDVQLFENLKNKKLIEHINRVGKLFYKKEQ
jgi:uncharacterized protein